MANKNSQPSLELRVLLSTYLPQHSHVKQIRDKQILESKCNVVVNFIFIFVIVFFNTLEEE